MEKCLTLLTLVFYFAELPAGLNYIFQLSAVFVFALLADLKEN